MQLSKSFIFQILVLVALVAATQAQILSDLTSVFGGLGQTIASGATSVFGDATSGAAGAFSTLTSGASGAFSTATSGAASVATSIATAAATSGLGSATSQATINAAASLNGAPVSVLAVAFTVLLGSAIAGSFIL